jgi:hypothetical protein
MDQEDGSGWQLTPPEVEPTSMELNAPEGTGDQEVPRMTEQQRENAGSHR